MRERAYLRALIEALGRVDVAIEHLTAIIHSCGEAQGDVDAALRTVRAALEQLASIDPRSSQLAQLRLRLAAARELLLRHETARTSPTSGRDVA